jgi:hypothetical protein
VSTKWTGLLILWLKRVIISQNTLSVGQVAVHDDLDQFIFMLGWQTYAEHDGHRDAKIHIICEGTCEMQQLVIARAISGLRIE